jgi:hypothetical protein
MTFADGKQGENMMEETTLCRFKWFWAWQDHEEEAWLRKMAQQGWHLSSFFPTIYTFARGEPRDDIYRLDYINLKKADFDEYLQLFLDAGWEFVGGMSGWQYFRKPFEAGDVPEIHTDAPSKIQKYRRLLGYLIMFLPIWVVILPRSFRLPYSIVFCLPGLLLTLFMLVWTYAIVRISIRIRQLKQL